MPAAIVAVAGMAAGAGAAAAAVGAGLVVAGGIGAAIISGVVGMAASALLSSAAGLNKKESSSQSVDQLAKGVLLNTAGTVDPIMVVYGNRRLGGTRVLTESSGASNEYLHIVIAHCEGPIASIDAVYLDGTPTTDAKFSGLVTVETFLGHDDQAACQSLIDALPGKWTAAHRLRGVAYTYVRLKYDSNVFNSLPTITADIRGRTVYDPRSGATAWSNNPSLCSRDYMTNARYGRGVPATEIDDVASIVAANACEMPFTAPDGTSHARHTCNGVVNTDQSSADNMVNILACCRGMLVFSARGYGLVIDKAEVPSDFEFNEDNIAGSWTFSPGGKRSRFNRVRGNWFNPANDWQADIAVADSPTFRADDNGLMLEAQVQIPFITNPYEVQVLTERHLRQSRFGMTATFRAFIAGMFCEVGDVVPITHSTPGWVAKPFRITRISLLSSDEVEVEVAEYDDSVYSATPLTTPRLSMTTNLPDPSNIPAPTNLALAMSTVDQPNGSSVPRFTATWTAPLSMWVVGYDVAWREEDSPWDTAFVTEPKFTLLSTAVGRSYEVRVRAVGSLGNKSVWVSTSGTQPVPTTPPAAPLAHAVGGLFCVRLDWAFGDTRQDIRATEIWYCGNNDRGAATRLSPEPFPKAEYTHPGMSPGAGGYYWLRVVDVWGNESAWYPAAEHEGLYAGCSTDPSDLLTQLQGALGMPQLAAELAAPIAQIDGMATDIIQRAIDIDGLSQRVLFERAVTDATIKTDPVTGKIQLLATAVTTTDVEARLTQAEVDINAAEGSISSTVATLETVENDLSSAQSQIAQLANTISLGVSDVQIADIAGQVSGAITVDSAAASQALAEAAIRQALGLDAASDKELLSRSTVAVARFDIKANSDAISAEASSRLTLAAVVDQQKAALLDEQTVRADAVSAEATARQSLAASLNHDIASVQTSASASASAITGLQAKWSVKAQVVQDGNYVVSGIELLSGAGGSTFAILADRLLVYQPDGQGAPKQVLTMGTVNGVAALGFDGSGMFDGSVTARQINGTGLKITGNGEFTGTVKAGSIVAGDISAATGHFTGRVNIAEAQIGTLELAGNAVTVPVSAQGGASAQTAWADFCGAPVCITASVTLVAGNSMDTQTGYINIYRDGALIYQTAVYMSSGAPGMGTGSAVVVDYPGCGAHYYTVSGSGTTTVSCVHSGIVAMGVKR